MLGKEISMDGYKATLSIMSGVILFLITSFVSVAWFSANEGRNKAYEIGERMTAMEVKFSSFQGDLQEIKDLLRRKVPG